MCDTGLVGRRPKVRSHLRITLVLGAALTWLVAGSTTATAATLTYSDSYGAVSAQLTERTSTGGGLTLVISRQGVDFTDTGISEAVCGQNQGCEGAADAYGSPAVAVRRASGSTEPDVLVHLTNGGNIWCRVTLIYHYDSTRSAYERSVHFWSDAADSGPPRALGAQQQVFFVSDDGRFRYRFGCGACTPGPIQIWQDRDGILVDVTRRFPNLIEHDAGTWRRLFLRQRAAEYGADGVLAAYVADAELLGRGSAAWRFVHVQGQAGYVTRAGSGFSSAAQFYSQLSGFLRKLGY
jgi:hypothetical protein